MIKVKRIYAPPSPDDGKRVYVDRLWPRGMKKEQTNLDEWLKEISPGDALRKWFSHDPARFEEFKRSYARELRGRSETLERLKKESRKGTVTLLFSAKDVEHNNAVVLKKS
jgi:uncharacterized protein YeaO (DUF488 family)